MPGKLKVSVSTFNEIASLLEKQGQKINQQGQFLIEKDTELQSPIDYRNATIRRDCIIEAVKMYCVDREIDVIGIAGAMFAFILTGENDTKLTIQE